MTFSFSTYLLFNEILESPVGALEQSLKKSPKISQIFALSRGFCFAIGAILG